MIEGWRSTERQRMIRGMIALMILRAMDVLHPGGMLDMLVLTT